MLRFSRFVSAFDRLNVPIYEEVAKMPPFERKTLVLIGMKLFSLLEHFCRYFLMCAKRESVSFLHHYSQP